MRSLAASRVGGPQHFNAVTSAAPVTVITGVIAIIREGLRCHVIQHTVRLLQATARQFTEQSDFAANTVWDGKEAVSMAAVVSSLINFSLNF